MRRQSRVDWALNVMAPWILRVMSPWALGVGVLVSFTAVAGQQDPTGEMTLSPLAARAPDGGEATSYRAASFGEAATGDYGAYGQTRALVHKARHFVGEPQDIRSIPDEREPHVDLKPEVKDFPQVDRTHKGDPVVAMRPTMETRATRPGALGLIQPAHLSFSIEGRSSGGRAAVALPPRALMPDDPLGEAEARPAEVSRPAEPPATTQKSAAAASPAQTASAATSSSAAEALLERAAHGATPSVSRAVALGSSTPAQPDATPIEASFAGATLALGAPGKKESGRPVYASLVSADKMDREKRCLAEAVYFESRSEPESGQAAVAQVVLNRVSSGLYPSTICGVVYQNRHHYHGCQFSFACEGRSLRITERDSWERAVRLANEVMDGRTYNADVGGSTHYHANYVRPRWARALTKMDVIGRHIFYRLKPGQT